MKKSIKMLIEVLVIGMVLSIVHIYQTEIQGLHQFIVGVVVFFFVYLILFMCYFLVCDISKEGDEVCQDTKT